MGYHVATLARRSILTLALGAVGCSETEPSAPVPGGASTITLTNDGASAFTEVRVITSARDSLPRISTLNAGQTLGPFAVGALHSAPFVEATAQGRVMTAHPVEGFSGFNPALAAGAYVVRLRVTDGILDIRVAPM